MFQTISVTLANFGTGKGTEELEVTTEEYCCTDFKYGLHLKNNIKNKIVSNNFDNFGYLWNQLS